MYMETLIQIKESYRKLIKEFREWIKCVIVEIKDMIKTYAGKSDSSSPSTGCYNSQSKSKTTSTANDVTPKSSPRPVKMQIVDGGRVIGFHNPNYINSQFVGQKKGKKKGKSRKKAEDEQTVNKKIKRI